MNEKGLYCKECHELLDKTDASHMLFNKSAKIKKDFLSCENPTCEGFNILVALIKKD